MKYECMILGIPADDEMGFFASQAAQIAVQEGSADIGSAIHHARVYRCWKTNAKGVRKYFYGMILRIPN